ncbi:TPA: hypothetical protein ACH3X3_002720 [Trebouxia sp. C0006]
MQSGPLVHYVQVRLDDSIGLIDDMEETLDSMLDPKLHHMREDIAAKEARNNSAHHTCWSRRPLNNGKLLAALEVMLAPLDPPEDSHDQLEQIGFDNVNLWDLVAEA